MSQTIPHDRHKNWNITIVHTCNAREDNQSVYYCPGLFQPSVMRILRRRSDLAEVLGWLRVVFVYILILYALLSHPRKSARRSSRHGHAHGLCRILHLLHTALRHTHHLVHGIHTTAAGHWKPLRDGRCACQIDDHHKKAQWSYEFHFSNCAHNLKMNLRQSVGCFSCVVNCWLWTVFLYHVLRDKTCLSVDSSVDFGLEQHTLNFTAAFQHKGRRSIFLFLLLFPGGKCHCWIWLF